MKLIQSRTEQCLFKNRQESLFIGTYVDDVLVVGNKELAGKFIDDLKKIFTITIQEKVNKFVGCELTWDEEKNSVLLTQEGIISRIGHQFKDVLMITKKSETPAPPGSVIIRTVEDDPILSEEDQEIYQSGVG